MSFWTIYIDKKEIYAVLRGKEIVEGIAACLEGLCGAAQMYEEAAVFSILTHL